MFRYVRRVLNWWHSIWEPKKGERWEAEKPKQAPVLVPKMEGITVNKAGLWGKVEGELTTEWTKVSTTKEAKSSNELTENELQEIAKRGWDAVKALEIKRVWATGVSREEAAKIINKKGFSPSSIKPFYTLFNSGTK